MTIEHIRDAILTDDTTADDFAGLELPESYRAVTVHAPDNEIGELVEVKVKGHTGYWLEGELVGAVAAEASLPSV